MNPRWTVAIILALALMAAGAVVFGGPVVRFFQGQAVKAERKEETATDTAVSKAAEAQGQAALGQQQGRIADQVIERHTETIRYVEKANAASDAKAPLGPDRERRIADHDRFLCEQRPAVCAGGPGSASDDAGVR